MFQQSDVTEYYNTTLNHYKSWWNLNQNLSLHYGIWDKDVKSFSDSLVNTNKTLRDLANIQKTDRVLDAGCGVGGAALFLSQTVGSKTKGITLSEKQLAFAKNAAKSQKLDHLADFAKMDYTQTSFPDASFDVVWACESVCHAADKKKFITEAYRILKKGGRLIMSDFFITKEDQKDDHNWVKKWGNTWGISQFVSSKWFCNTLEETGFSTSTSIDYTPQIRKSAYRMYQAALLGAIPSEIYNLFHPNVSRFAKTHYKCGYYQYKALKAKLWNYNVILAVK